MPYEEVSIEDFHTGFGYWGNIRKERIEKIFEPFKDTGVNPIKQYVKDEYDKYLNYYLSAAELNKSESYDLASHKNDEDIVTIDDFKMGRTPKKYNYLLGHVISIYRNYNMSNQPITKKKMIEEFDKIMSKDSNRERELSTNSITKQVMKVRINCLVNKGIPLGEIEPYENFEKLYYSAKKLTGYGGSLEGDVIINSNIAEIDELFEDTFNMEYEIWEAKIS
ncbi:MAG: hypothetical protein IJS60_07010 [Abditibacteriota bacterium]|nr:hypothetical protein [Abditibacteriota bacterium]